jgi:hypothetical protein
MAGKEVCAGKSKCGKRVSAGKDYELHGHEYVQKMSIC